MHTHTHSGIVFSSQKKDNFLLFVTAQVNIEYKLNKTTDKLKINYAWPHLYGENGGC